MSDPAAALKQALEQQRQTLERAVRELQKLDSEHHAHLGESDSAHLNAWRELGTTLVPSIDDALALARAASVLRLPALEPAAAADAVADRRARLEAQRASLGELVDLATARSRAEALTVRLAELADHAVALRRSVEELERDADFREFRQRGGESSWWTLSHYRVQACGRRAVERFGARRRVDAAEALVRKHASEREALATLEGEQREVSEEQRRLHGLVDEHERLTAELERVEEFIANDLRAAVVESARGLSEDAFLELFAAEREFLRASRGVVGTRAQRRYLVACFAHWIERARAEMRTVMQDLELALAGAGRPIGRGTTPGEINAETTRKQRELEQNARQYRTTAQRLLAFRAWERCDPLAGELWWDHLSGGLVDGSFIDEVTWHRTMRRTTVRRSMGSGHDKREGWADNADNAADRLAAAHADWQATADEDEEP